ncbi:hypothetical protein OA85_08090 [Flavobacterium sp. AED]|nr:hypothetical protein OA85_08090 [Flavobacterium sp. AED]
MIENEAIRDNNKISDPFIIPIFRKPNPTFNILSKVTKKTGSQVVIIPIKSIKKRLNTSFLILNM